MPPPDVQTVLADPNFRALSPKDKNSVLLKIDPNYAGLPPQEQTKVLNAIQYPSSAPAKEGFWGGAWDELKGQVEGTVKSFIPSKENAYGLASPGGPLSYVMNFTDAVRNYERRKQEGRSLPYRVLTGATEMAGIPTGAQGEEAAAARGDTAGVLGHAAVPVAETIAGAGAKEIGDLPAVRSRLPWTEDFRVRTGTEKLGRGLKVPSSEEAIRAAEARPHDLPPAMEEAKALDTAKADLAEIERRNPLGNKKGSANMFARAKNIFDYDRELWQKAHQEPIARHAQMPFDPYMDQAIQAGQEVLTPEAIKANPVEARAAVRWLKGLQGGQYTLEFADNLMREINDDIRTPAAQKAYGNLGSRVRVAVAARIRDGIDSALEATGEDAVRPTNIRYHALQVVGKRVVQQAIAEMSREGAKGVVPEWMHAYMFAPNMADISVGIGASAYRMFRPSPSKEFARGMTRLSKTGLEPPPVRTPEYVGRKPIGLLPGPGETYTDLGKQAPGGPRTTVPPIELPVSSSYTLEDAGGTRWAVAPDGVRISVKPGTPPHEIAAALDRQRRMQMELRRHMGH